MTDIIGAIPLSVAGIVATLVNALLAFVVILVIDKVIAHNLEPKKALIISLVALFLTPVLGAFAASYIALPDLVFAYVMPLLVWVVLGEILLEGDMTAKLKVMVIAFIVYIVLSFTVAPMLLSFVSGVLPV